MRIKNWCSKCDSTFALSRFLLFRECLWTRMFDPVNKRRNQMPDKILICQDCSREFVFTEGEQEFYKEKGLQNEPKRCPDCRKAKKAQFNRNRRRQSN